MPRTRGRFSLGSAAFRCLPSDECVIPAQHAPDAWGALFAEEHADDDVCQRLCKASPASRQWVLRTAPQATLKFDCRDMKPDSVRLQRRVEAARRDLATRGTLPTTLHFEWGRDDDGERAVASCARAVSQGPHNITAVILQGRATTDITTQLAAVFPALKGLTIQDCSWPLPPSAHFPKLSELSVKVVADEADVQHRMWASIAAYVAQLQSLCISGGPPRYTRIFAPTPMFQWMRVFTATTSTLTHLTVRDGRLCNDELVTLLVERVPALTHLSVGRVDNLRVDHSSKSWGVQHLCVLEEENKWDLERLSLLPRHREGRVVGVKAPDGTAYLETVSKEGVAVRALDRLPEWRVEAKTMTLKCCRDLAKADQPTAFSNVIKQLASYPNLPSVIDLSYWKLTDRFARAIVEAHHHAPHLRFGLAPGDLTTKLLGTVLKCGAAVAELRVQSLRLQSDKYAKAPWPWDTLKVARETEVAQLMRLPDPAQAVKRPAIITEVPNGPQALNEQQKLWLSHVSVQSPYNPSC